MAIADAGSLRRTNVVAQGTGSAASTRTATRRASVRGVLPDDCAR